MSLGLEKEQKKNLEGDISQLADVPVETNTEEPQDEAEECDDSKEIQQEEPNTNENEANPDESDEEPPTLLCRSECTWQCPDRYGVWIYSAKQQEKEPVIVKEAISSSESEKWKEAMEEMRYIEANEVWELVELPKGKKTIGCKWVYKRKLDVDGSEMPCHRRFLSAAWIGLR